MTETQLKPCPFCGETPDGVDIGDSEAVVRCDGCACEGPPATIGENCDNDDDDAIEAAAIAFWNQRKLGVIT